MAGSDSTLLTRQKELLLQKLETFESTNRALRHLLREQHSREVLLCTNSNNIIKLHFIVLKTVMNFSILLCVNTDGITKTLRAERRASEKTF